MKNLLLFIFPLFFSCLNISAQSVTVIHENKQHSFFNTIPSGNYSGIVNIKDNIYAVVDDKSKNDGFHLFRIDIDSINGDIKNVKYLKFCSSGLKNRDGEGITFLPRTKTLLISGESDSKIKEYDLDGSLTNREVQLKTITDNYGYESLSYNEKTGIVWTGNESTMSEDGEQATPENRVKNVIRLQSFNENLKAINTYRYIMDEPESTQRAWHYAYGVSEILALDDSSLLILEREFFIPTSKIGAWVNCKLYQVNPISSISAGMTLPKTFIYQWQTKLTLLNHSIANYEGMCLGPKLKDGSQVLIFISDSQNHYGGILKDWFKTIIIK